MSIFWLRQGAQGEAMSVRPSMTFLKRTLKMSSSSILKQAIKQASKQASKQAGKKTGKHAGKH